MSDLFLTRGRRTPWAHQIEGTRWLLNTPAAILADDVGLGKSKQWTDAFCTTVDRGEIDAAVIVTPGFARSVWADADPLLGEFAAHAWAGLDYEIIEYTAKSKWNPKRYIPSGKVPLVVSNYEFVRGIPERDIDRLHAIRQWAMTRKVWLLLDESWSLESHKATQTKVCYLLRQVCKRVTLLNGTPGAPERLFTQFQILDPAILDCQNYNHFKARHLEMGGFENRTVKGYQRMDEFAARTAPYILRREGGIDLPPMLPPMSIEARLTEPEWAAYKSMRDHLVTWLDNDGQEASVARQAGVRTLRLSQILAGFVGGVERIAGAEEDEDDPELALFDETGPRGPVREIGKAKLKAVLDYTAAQNLNKYLVWCGFRPEMFRFQTAFADRGQTVHLLMGQQKADERTATKRCFAPGNVDPAPAVMVGNPRAGGAALNFSAANVAIYATNSWSLKARQQSVGRINRPGQTRPVRIIDVLAVGPNNQKTIDHAIIAALRHGEDVAQWTAAMWKKVLTRE